MQTMIILYTGFWLTHLFHVFYSLAFPFKSQKFMASHSATRIAHLIEFIVIATLGLLCSTITIIVSGYEFTGLSQYCTPASLDGYFYAEAVPDAIGLSICILLLCASAMIVRNVSCLFNQSESNKHK